MEDPDHAAHACQTALDMLDALKAFNRNNEGKYPATEIGIGLNTGICCVGNLGSEQRFDYSVIGDEVNVGARLESQTKTYGLSILVGGETARDAAAKGYVFAPVDYVRVKGKDEKIDILMLLGGPDHPVAPDTLRAIAPVTAMVEAYKINDWAKVSHHLGAAQAINAPEFKSLLNYYSELVKAAKMAT